jgi:ABC-type branched-subunit amino acid transport system ATPase component
MSLVTDVCTKLYALDFGRLIYAGDVSGGLTSTAVRGAYLGAAEV